MPDRSFTDPNIALVQRLLRAESDIATLRLRSLRAAPIFKTATGVWTTVVSPGPWYSLSMRLPPGSWLLHAETQWEIQQISPTAIPDNSVVGLYSWMVAEDGTALSDQYDVDVALPNAEHYTVPSGADPTESDAPQAGHLSSDGWWESDVATDWHIGGSLPGVVDITITVARRIYSAAKMMAIPY